MASHYPGAQFLNHGQKNSGALIHLSHSCTVYTKQEENFQVPGFIAEIEHFNLARERWGEFPVDNPVSDLSPCKHRNPMPEPRGKFSHKSITLQASFSQSEENTCHRTSRDRDVHARGEQGKVGVDRHESTRNINLFKDSFLFHCLLYLVLIDLV